MDTPIFAKSANPAVDNPLLFVGKARLLMLQATGAIQMVSAPGYRRAAQYVSDRSSYRPTPAPSTPAVSKIPPFNAALLTGPKWAWVPCGMSWQMLDSYGGVARHFKSTKNGLNCCKNKTSSPYDHKDFAMA